MPKDPSLHKILVIGSDPIVIGQGCEFDDSGVQACKALKEEGYTGILVNSNPAASRTAAGRAPISAIFAAGSRTLRRRAARQRRARGRR